MKTKTTLNISKEIQLPQDAVIQTFAMIGRKGAGKTYLATMVAEGMLDIPAQVIVIDPVGVWYGLRVAADGKSKGKDIFVIGGDHGDVPLIPTAGARIAKLVVEKGISAVIDVSGFRIGEHKRFAADFAEEFFHLKKSHRSPVHIFIEEAQKIIPQRVGPDEARMVGAFEQIVRLGRNYGIGCSLVTQRPQSVNKEVLSQVECLCVLQVTGPHERKALEEWVQEAGADRTLIGELPGLERGEGYVWSPSWLRIYKKVHFAKKQTFDASATPEVGKKTKAAFLSAVDVESLKADMADVVSQAEKDNPVVLKKRIAELEKATPKELPVAMGVSQWLEYGKKNGYDSFFTKKISDEVEKRMNAVFAAEQEELIKQFVSIFKTLNTVAETVKDIKMPDLKLRMAARMDVYPGPKVKVVDRPHVYGKGLAERLEDGIKQPKRVEVIEGEHTTLTQPEMRILNAIAWFESVSIKEPEQSAVSFLAGYTFGSSGFNNPRGSLRVKGLIKYNGSKVSLTDSGRMIADRPDEALTTSDLHEKVLSVLPSPEQRLLKPLLAAYPESMTNGGLAEAADYTEGSSGFNNPRGRLKTLGLIDYPASGQIRAKDYLFI
jgi:hypothetical protein